MSMRFFVPCGMLALPQIAFNFIVKGYTVTVLGGNGVQISKANSDQLEIDKTGMSSCIEYSAI